MIVRIALAFVAAVVISAGLGTLIQSQLNLARLAALGAPVPFPVRMETSAHDLLNFGPAYAALTAVAFGIAFSATGLLRRRFPGPRLALYALAGGLGVLAMLAGMNLALNFTPIAAARSGTGMALLAAAGALGGACFAGLLNRQRR